MNHPILAVVEHGRLSLAPGWGKPLPTMFGFPYGFGVIEVHYTCETCQTSYPVIDGEIRCNGHVVDRCPWCRTDSAPWKNGRGS